MCTHIDCPEYLGAGARLERGCKFSYKPLACCASQNEQICPENHSTLHKCSYRGIEVVKGEKFTPLDDPCYSCTCDENFKDHMYPRDQGKNCQKATCGFETAYKDKLLEGCVRVHLGESRCCGHDWICRKYIYLLCYISFMSFNNIFFIFFFRLQPKTCQIHK